MKKTLYKKLFLNLFFLLFSCTNFEYTDHNQTLQRPLKYVSLVSTKEAFILNEDDGKKAKQELEIELAHARKIHNAANLIFRVHLRGQGLLCNERAQKLKTSRELSYCLIKQAEHAICEFKTKKGLSNVERKIQRALASAKVYHEAILKELNEELVKDFDENLKKLLFLIIKRTDP